MDALGGHRERFASGVHHVQLDGLDVDALVLRVREPVERLAGACCKVRRVIQVERPRLDLDPGPILGCAPAPDVGGVLEPRVADVGILPAYGVVWAGCEPVNVRMRVTLGRVQREVAEQDGVSLPARTA